MPERYIFDAKILEFAEEQSSSDIYISVKLVLLTSDINLNKVQFSPEFITEIATNKQNYLSVPLVAEIDKLNKKQYKNLTHKYNSKTGQFGTSMIGSFVDFSTDEVDGVLRLIGEARIPKRFEATVEALQELYEEQNLKFSYEVLVSSYTVSNGIKFIDVGGGTLIGMAVVSDPAVPAAKAMALVAALEKDNLIEGGEFVSKVRSKDMTCEEFFANSKVKLVEKAELDLTQIQRKIYNYCRESMGENWWNWDVVEFSVNYFILMSWDDGDYYKVTFTVNGNDLTFSPKVKVAKNYTEIPEEDENEMAELKELQDSLAKALAEIETFKAQIADKDKIIAEKEAALATKETELATVNEKVNTLSASVLEKDNLIKELEPFKAEVEKINLEKAEAEKVTKRTKMKEKYSKLLSAEVIALPEIAEAIENLNESVLQAKVTELALAAAEKDQKKPDGKKVTLASRITDNIELSGSEPNSLRAKYSL
jgi:hypothetical protein